MLTHERLTSFLAYDPETGVFTRLVDHRGHKVGSVAGHNSYKRLNVRVDGQSYSAHRLAWFYVYGVWPTKFIDHINGDTSDNRIANLREASNQENMRNLKLRVTNKTGAKGVCVTGKRFSAFIKANYKSIGLGTFDTIDEAAHAYNKAAIALHGEFACLNPVGASNAN
jgi:hypothetical protein